MPLYDFPEEFMALIIRPLSFENEDVRNCLEIYNHYIKNTTVTFEETELE